jgi:hypothetical protein
VKRKPVVNPTVAFGRRPLFGGGIGKPFSAKGTNHWTWIGNFAQRQELLHRPGKERLAIQPMARTSVQTNGKGRESFGSFGPTEAESLV